ncbi:hypothetical protein FQN54_005822 [Arachnomyces sp. PD_36]|nr:hypothetical protein FQN54_005822 [Arachnomyces sp. PD_36]
MLDPWIIAVLGAISLGAEATPIRPRLDDGLAITPPMGWNSYNAYSCSPNETVIHSNADALISLGLAGLGYEYVTTDCGWTLPERDANGELTWNEERFPNGFPALGKYIHDLGLLFGVYSDSGIKMCMSGEPDQAGSLFHEDVDAKTFARWEADALKYDNCYSDASIGYPNVEYEPSTSPAPRFANMSRYIQETDRDILFQICEWGIDFPALWAPEYGHTWRMSNDIIPAWRTVFRIINQVVPQTSFAGPGQWPDLDMLFVGNGIFTEAEEQTHFSLWSIAKSPLYIGAALNDEYTSIRDESLAILSQEDVISYNQDLLGISARFVRRWSQDEYEIWSGPLSGNRTVVALVNWSDEERELQLDLPDVGLQTASTLKNIWSNETAEGVLTSYAATVAPHGTMLLELGGTTVAGHYPASVFAKKDGSVTTFGNIYGLTSSALYTLDITFVSGGNSSASEISVSTSASEDIQSVKLEGPSNKLTVEISLSASSENTISIDSPIPIEAVDISAPAGKYYPSTSFSVSGGATVTNCTVDYCQPVGSKIANISPNTTASLTIASSDKISAAVEGAKYVEVDYINNEVSLDTAWEDGTNTRNLTVSVNGGEPTRLEVPLSGVHSELFSPEKGWQDSATYGVLVSGWTDGENEVVVSNQGGELGVQPLGADFVGLRVYN